MIRTTVVGSWPLPVRYADSLCRYQRGELTDLQAEPILNAAVSLALREQRSTGVDQVMGGELFADPFLGHLPRHLTGIERVSAAEESEPQHARSVFYRRVGSLEAPRGIGYVAAFRREAKLDPQLTKASCPGPYTLLSFLLLADPAAFAALPEASDIVAREVAGLVQAGAREVQLDAPTEVSALCLFNRERAEAVDAISRVFRGLRNVVRTVHFCFRGISAAPASAEKNFEKLLPAIIALRGKIDRVHLPCTDDAARAMVRAIPEEMELIAGIADVSGEPEPVEVLVARGRELLQQIPAQRLWLSTTCGFRLSTRERAIGTLTNLAAAARRLAE